jgi:hypothetical protein
MSTHIGHQQQQAECRALPVHACNSFAKVWQCDGLVVAKFQVPYAADMLAFYLHDSLQQCLTWAKLREETLEAEGLAKL